MEGDGLVVLINLRALVSLLGIFLIVWFTWQWDRKWEQIGPESRPSRNNDEEESAGSDYKNMEGGDGTTAVFEISFEGKKLPPYNKMALIGWVILAISHIFPRWSWFGIDTSWISLVCVGILGVVGYVHAVFIPQAIVQRQYAAKKGLWNTILVSGMIMVGILTYMQNTIVPVYPAVLGSICISLAPMLLWKARLVGDTFDSEGRINPQPVLFNFGAPLLMFGWFWYWIGMNVLAYFNTGTFMPYLHVYLGLRMIFAMVGAVLIVIVYWVIGYGLDEIENLSGEPDSAQSLQLAPAFGMQSFFCGEVYEIKVFTIMAWASLGLAMFFPYDWDDYMDWVFFVGAVVMGYCVAMIEERGFRLRMAAQVRMWSTRAWFMLGLMAVIIPMQKGVHYFAVILSVAGATGFGYGMKFLNQDRKRGEKWLETDEVQTPTVYSYGALLVPLSALVLAWSISMRPEQ
mmetsp:Transcript_34291/g.71388  ORF Transcript_34291/g.71388 Transcript_34291/m.71388 type:complete len:458 (-) Transcript_34291:259-1632(-)|eukprot:CAMPEP_0172452740 /NCGR_PEP_ID=MMETSP1065-20121228/10309_1 /TAXON_ID=265537 /ORGANISM="Amphiprora paludosa, Strain CCMP125" /LENGTH=457 /DNA_ID=CAMNT_0013204845 /DNA_START=53 /DNA_END=1426 /DNA_ORIENTATION=-